MMIERDTVTRWWRRLMATRLAGPVAGTVAGEAGMSTAEYATVDLVIP